MKLSYKTEFTANAKAEFRYSPANNGNGGLKIDFKDKKYPVIFFANIKKTRDLPEVLPVGQKALSWLR